MGVNRPPRGEKGPELSCRGDTMAELLLLLLLPPPPPPPPPPPLLIRENVCATTTATTMVDETTRAETTTTTTTTTTTPWTAAYNNNDDDPTIDETTTTPVVVEESLTPPPPVHHHHHEARRIDVNESSVVQNNDNDDDDEKALTSLDAKDANTTSLDDTVSRDDTVASRNGSRILHSANTVVVVDVPYNDCEAAAAAVEAAAKERPMFAAPLVFEACRAVEEEHMAAAVTHEERIGPHNGCLVIPETALDLGSNETVPFQETTTATAAAATAAPEQQQQQHQSFSTMDPAATTTTTTTMEDDGGGAGGRGAETVEATSDQNHHCQTVQVDPDNAVLFQQLSMTRATQEPAASSVGLTDSPLSSDTATTTAAHIGPDQSADTATTRPLDEEEEAQAVTQVTSTCTGDSGCGVAASVSDLVEPTEQLVAGGAVDAATSTTTALASNGSSETNEAATAAESITVAVAAVVVVVTGDAVVETSGTNETCTGLNAVMDTANLSSHTLPMSASAVATTVDADHLAPLESGDSETFHADPISPSPMDQLPPPPPPSEAVTIMAYSGTSKTTLARDAVADAAKNTLFPLDETVVEDSCERTKADPDSFHEAVPDTAPKLPEAVNEAVSSSVHTSSLAEAPAAPVAATKPSVPAVKTKAKSFVAPTTSTTNIASPAKQRKKLAIPSIFENGPATSAVASFTPTARIFSPKKMTNPFEKGENNESERPLVAKGTTRRCVTPTASKSLPCVSASNAEADSDQADPSVLGETDATKTAADPLSKGKADKAESEGTVKRKLAIPTVFAAPKASETFVPPKTPTKVWTKKVASIPVGPSLPLFNHGRGNVSVITSCEKSTLSKIAPVEVATLESKGSSKVKPTSDRSKWSSTPPAAAAPSQAHELSLAEQIAALEAEIAQTAAEAEIAQTAAEAAASAAVQAPPAVVGDVEYEEVSYYEEVDASENTLESMEEIHLLSCQTKTVLKGDKDEKLEPAMEIPTSDVKTEMVQDANETIDTLSVAGAQSTLGVVLGRTDQDIVPKTEVVDPIHIQDAVSSISQSEKGQENATIVQQDVIPYDEDEELKCHRIPPSEQIELSTTKSDACLEVNDFVVAGSTSATSLNELGDHAGATASLDAVDGKEHKGDLDIAKESAISSTDPYNVHAVELAGVSSANVAVDGKDPNDDLDDAKEAALPMPTNPKDAKGEKAAAEGEQVPRKKMRRLHSFFQNVKEKSKRRLLPGARVKAPKSHA
jgi:hypothetical protein